MRFGLIANLKRDGAADAVRSLIEWSNKNGHELVLCNQLEEFSSNEIKLIPRDEIPSAVDILVSMGGDGTLLSAARQVGKNGIPVLGINLGSLGFLTMITPQKLTEALNAVVSGEYMIEKRMLLKATVVGSDALESPYALNDVVIDNGPVSRLIDINLKVNGEEVVTYRADGLVIATPTGSTAYSLAVGGPIVHPRMDAMIASPISSFSLSTRPMVFPGEDHLEIGVHSDHGVAGLTLDGQIAVPLQNNDQVKISRADFYLKLITFPQNSYFQLLKSKLHWGHRLVGDADPQYKNND